MQNLLTQFKRCVSVNISVRLVSIALTLLIASFCARSDIKFKISDPYHSPIAGANVHFTYLNRTFTTDNTGLIEIDLEATAVRNPETSRQCNNIGFEIRNGFLLLNNSNNLTKIILSIHNFNGRLVARLPLEATGGNHTIDLNPILMTLGNKIHLVELGTAKGTRIAGPVKLFPFGINVKHTSPLIPVTKRNASSLHKILDTLTITADEFETRTMPLFINLPFPVDSSIQIMLKLKKNQRISGTMLDSLHEKYSWPADVNVSLHFVLPGDNIQNIIRGAARFDVINFAEGIYFLDSSIVLSDPILLRSIDGPWRTIIDGQHKSRCVLMEKSYTVIDGFTIRYGDATGPKNWGSDEDETLCDNGGGIQTGGCLCDGYSSGPLPLIANCVVINNHAGAMGGGGLHLKGGTVRNCLVAFNSAVKYAGGISIVEWPVTIEYTTISMNSSGWWIRQFNGTTFIKNSILAKNNGNNWVSEGQGDAKRICIWHSLIEDKERFIDIDESIFDTIAPITGDPFFTAPADTIFTLKSSSQCIDAGSFMDDSLTKRYLTSDLMGNPRVSGKTIDIGAFEFNQNN